MPRKEIFSYLLVGLVYALVVTLWGRHFRPEFSLFWLGAAVGTLLLYLDPLASAYLTLPEAPFSQEVKQMIGQKRLKQAAKAILLHHREQEEPILHSAIFQAALIILAFYIVTSSGSLLGSGLVMGMALHLAQDEVREWKSPEKLNRMLFWNIHREITEKEQKIYLIVIFFLFALETTLLV